MPTDSPGNVAYPRPAPRIPSQHTMSLGVRVAISTIASAVMAVLVAGAIAYPLAREAAVQESEENLNQIAAAVAAAIERSASADPADAIPPRLEATLNAQQINGAYFAANSRLPGVLSRADIANLNQGIGVSGRQDTDGGAVLYSARPALGGTVLLVQPISATDHLASRSVTRFAIALAIGVAIATAFGLLLARRLTRPLRNAAEAAKRLGAGDREVQLEVEGPREIAELADALNDLRNALALSEGRQRDFLLSVSHELRTPLTAIRGYAEALADDVVPAGDVARTGATMQSEAERLNTLVSDLLELARMEAVDFPISPTVVDLAGIGRQASEVWADRCAAEGLYWRAELPDGPLPGNTDPTRVRQIIDNLCANALRVTPVGGQIVLAVRPDGDYYVTFEVRDSGPGLTPDDCEVAFQPAELYSRYRGIRRVGTGVGLALVGRLATRLGGRAAAGTAAEGGARFTITIARSIE